MYEKMEKYKRKKEKEEKKNEIEGKVYSGKASYMGLRRQVCRGERAILSMGE
jgi:hypothetical protein